MAAVNDYLKKLLYQYDCVVVPELGAFLTHYQSASFTETHGLYFPPRKRVAFNEALRLDDGILINYIMLHESVTREGAQRHISQFVQELRQSVSDTGRFELDGIGLFSHNDEGRLQFDPSLRHNFFGEAYGMSALTAQTVNRLPQAETSLPAVPVTAVGPVLTLQETVTFEPIRRSRPYWQVAAAALLVGTLGAVSYVSVIKPDQPLQSSLDPANLLRLPAFFAQPAGKQDTKVVPAARLVVRSSTPAPAPLASPEPVASKPVVPAKPAEVSVAEPVAATPPAPATVRPAAPVIAPKPAAVRPTEPVFTVIAGSFASKPNALRLRRQLRKAGYDDAYIIRPAEAGQLYKVAAVGSSDRSEAVARMAAISELAGTTAWIYKR